uniref:Tetraspanin n=1 Tax=Trichobilharzia regenti TaxID=157069 RepID=A0AA85J566_TRIRE|nr:unnamed protein product [Trichobilharzia regenti]
MHSTVRTVFRVLNIICLLICIIAFILFAIIFWTKIAVLALQPTLKNLKVDGDLSNSTVTDSVNRVLRHFARPITLTLMAITIIFICLYAFGVLVAYNRGSTFFLMYEVAITVFIIVHVLMLATLLSNPKTIRGGMENIFEKQFYGYESMKSLDGQSLFAAVVMINLKCCGFRDASDFNDVKMSYEDRYDGRDYTNVVTAVPCCHMNDDLQLKDKDCPISGSPDTYYIDGCKEPFSKKAFQVIALLAYASILLIVVNCALVVCVVLILRELWIHL